MDADFFKLVMWFLIYQGQSLFFISNYRFKYAKLRQDSPCYYGLFGLIRIRSIVRSFLKFGSMTSIPHFSRLVYMMTTFHSANQTYLGSSGQLTISFGHSSNQTAL